jgi:4'-phosphopantetheinyl transferase
VSAARAEVVQLRHDRENIDAWLGLLSDEERARADRFLRPDDRRRSILGRGLLRRVLGRKLGRAPETLRFGTSAHGKPTLADAPGVAFNLAHSGDWVLVGVAEAAEIGIDIEAHRADLDLSGVARAVFTSSEQAAIRTGPAAETAVRFFRQWTFKEAVVKAVGLGLSLDLKGFEIDFQTGAPRLVRHRAEGLGDVSAWRLEAIPAEPGYSAALALRA